MQQQPSIGASQAVLTCCQAPGVARERPVNGPSKGSDPHASREAVLLVDDDVRGRVVCIRLWTMEQRPGVKKPENIRPAVLWFLESTESTTTLTFQFVEFEISRN